MESEKRDFNLAAKIFLYLSLVANLILVINCFLTIKINASLDLSTTLPIMNLLFTLCIIIVGAFIFRISKIALSLFISLFIARLLILSSMGGYGFAFNLGMNLKLVLRDLVPFMIALCFKKDGISGWKAFFMKTSNTESIPETVDKSYSPMENSEKTDFLYQKMNDSVINEQTSETTTIEEENKENDININQSSISNSTEDENESSPTISTTDVEDSIKSTTNTHNQKTKLSKRIPLFLSLILILSGVTLFILIRTSAPEGFDGFDNKFKYFFGIHNNTLAKEYLTKSLNANANDLQEIGKEFFNKAILAKPSDSEIIDSLTKLCFDKAVENNENYSYDKVIELCNINLNNSPDHLFSLKYKAASYGSMDSLDKAYNTTELILLKDPNNHAGILFMSKIAYSRNDYKSLLKWSKKGYDLYNDDATFTYLYSKCLYDNGEYSRAKLLFEEAEKLDPYNWYRSRLIKIGGQPCTIQGLQIINKRKDGTIINRPNEMLYTNQCFIISPSITLKSIRDGEFTLMARLYTTDWNGREKLEGNQYFPVNFKQKGETVNLELNGWGDDTGISWKEGGCYIEIWWEGEKLYTKSFKIHDKIKVDLERSDREYKARMKEINKRIDNLRFSF